MLIGPANNKRQHANEGLSLTYILSIEPSLTVIEGNSVRKVTVRSRAAALVPGTTRSDRDREMRDR
jgi:hypothetical protein